VVHFRDPLLKAHRPPIVDAILQHLPSDGLEQPYDGPQVVEQVVEACLQGLQDYPLASSTIVGEGGGVAALEKSSSSSSLTSLQSPSRRRRRRSMMTPSIPDWVEATTAPTDYQVVHRLRELRRQTQQPPPPPQTQQEVVDGDDEDDAAKAPITITAVSKARQLKRDLEQRNQISRIMQLGLLEDESSAASTSTVPLTSPISGSHYHQQQQQVTQLKRIGSILVLDDTSMTPRAFGGACSLASRKTDNHEDDEGTTTLESPDATPCSTPESLGGKASSSSNNLSSLVNKESLSIPVKKSPLTRRLLSWVAMFLILIVIIILVLLGINKYNGGGKFSSKSKVEKSTAAEQLVPATTSVAAPEVVDESIEAEQGEEEPTSSSLLDTTDMTKKSLSVLDTLPPILPDCDFVLSPIQANVEAMLQDHNDETKCIFTTTISATMEDTIDDTGVLLTADSFVSPIETNVEIFVSSESQQNDQQDEDLTFDFVSPLETHVDAFLRVHHHVFLEDEYCSPIESNINQCLFGESSWPPSSLTEDRSSTIHTNMTLQGLSKEEDSTLEQPSLEEKDDPTGVPTLDQDRTTTTIPSFKTGPIITASLVDWVNDLGHVVLKSTQNHLQVQTRQARQQLDRVRTQSIPKLHKKASGLVSKAVQSTQSRMKRAQTHTLHVWDTAHTQSLRNVNTTLNDIGQGMRTIGRSGAKLSMDLSQHLEVGHSQWIQARKQVRQLQDHGHSHAILKLNNTLNGVGQGVCMMGRSGTRLSKSLSKTVDQVQSAVGKGTRHSIKFLARGQDLVVSQTKKNLDHSIKGLARRQDVVVSKTKNTLGVWNEKRKRLSALSGQVGRNSLKTLGTTTERMMAATYQLVERAGKTGLAGVHLASSKVAQSIRQSRNGASKSLIRGLTTLGHAAKQGQLSTVATTDRLRLGTNDTLNAIANGVRVAGKRTKHSFEIASHTGSQHFMATTARATQLGRLGTNNTLNVIGLGIRTTTERSNLAIHSIAQSSKNGFESFVGTTEHASRVACLGTNRTLNVIASSLRAASRGLGAVSRRKLADSTRKIGDNLKVFSTEVNRALTKQALHIAQTVMAARYATEQTLETTSRRGNKLGKSIHSTMTTLVSRFASFALSAFSRTRELADGGSQAGLRVISLVGAAIVAAFGFLSARISAGRQSVISIDVSSLSRATSTLLKNVLPAIPHEVSPSVIREVSLSSSLHRRNVPYSRRVGHRSTSRRFRGAADIARDSLLRANDPYISNEANLELSRTANRLSRADNVVRSTAGLPNLEARGISSLGLRRLVKQASDVMFASLTQGTLVIEMVAERSLLSVHQRIQATVGRTHDLAQLCVFAMSAVGEAVSRFLDNLTLQGQHALSILKMSMDDRRRDLILLAQEVARILAVRKAREVALLVSYNLLFVTMSFVQVGKNELHRSSERKIAAVLQVNMEAWKVAHATAAGVSPRLEGMGDARRAMVGALSQTKDALLGRFRKNGDRLKQGTSSMGHHLPFHKRLSRNAE
jgi:hypothetical protein